MVSVLHDWLAAFSIEAAVPHLCFIALQYSPSMTAKHVESKLGLILVRCVMMETLSESINLHQELPPSYMEFIESVQVCVCMCVCLEVGSYMRASKGMNKGYLESNGNGVLMRVYRELDPQKERKRKSSLTWTPAVIWNCTRCTRNITKPLKSKTQWLRMCVYVCDNKTTRLKKNTLCILSTVYSYGFYIYILLYFYTYLKSFKQYHLYAT